MYSFKLGQGSIILRVKLLDSAVTTGAGKTGLTSSSSGLIISTIADNEATATAYTQASSNVETITTLGTFAAPTSGKCRFKEVDATNHKGLYEIQIADARYAVSNARSVIVSISGVSGVAECDVHIPLTSLDPYDAVRAGLTALANAAAGASGGLLISGSNSGTTTLGALTVTGSTTLSDGLLVNRSSSNASAIVATGNGTGHGISAVSGSGATGNGINASSAATNGNGLNAAGAGTGSGLRGVGGSTGNGVTAAGGATSGHGLQATTVGSNEIDADIVGTLSTVSTATAVTTVNGLANNVITANSINTDAFTASKFASDVSTEFATTLLGTTVENNGSLTLKGMLRLFGAVLFGRTAVSGSSADFKTADNAKTRVSATTDSTNSRTAITVDVTD